MKLSQLIENYTKSPHLKGRLKINVELDNGDIVNAGTVSDLLIPKGCGKFHFEAGNTAFTADEKEIEFID
jgi:hypothetical protein